jgi:acyl-CoA thioesterase
LGVELVSISKGQCFLKATVKEEMVNGFNIAHGGISYSLSDSALAFASNSYGIHCVSIETSISHLAPLSIGDELVINCLELSRSRSLGHYQVQIHNQQGILISHFKGLVKIMREEWL